MVMLGQLYVLLSEGRIAEVAPECCKIALSTMHTHNNKDQILEVELGDEVSTEEKKEGMVRFV